MSEPAYVEEGKVRDEAGQLVGGYSCLARISSCDDHSVSQTDGAGSTEREAVRFVRSRVYLLSAVLQIETLHTAPVISDELSGPGAHVSPHE